MRKVMLVLALVVLLVGVVGAADDYVGSIKNVDGIHINDFVAGSVATANFSYDYLDDYGNNQYPHILRVNITSWDQDEYPVWKGDFELSGFVRKHTWFGLYHEDIELECSESPSLEIDHPLGVNVLDVPNGTFYCYNTMSGAIGDLSKHDEVFLKIGSHPALWPGDYTLFANLFYLSDTREPFVNITNKGLFDRYYRENDNVVVEAMINDGGGVEKVWAMAFLGYENWSLHEEEWDKDYYMATRDTSEDIVEGDYPLFVFAEDGNDNIGSDNVTLKIDRTGPEIVLIQPNGSVYSDVLPILVNVTDNEKAGVDNESVMYKLKEQGCDDGLNEPSCYNSGWVSLPNVGGISYGVNVNTTLVGLSSGSYNLQIKALDILENEGVLE